MSSKIFEKAEAAYRKASNAVPRVFDEVAIHFRQGVEMWLVEEALDEGWHLVNRAIDDVTTDPIASKYKVSYLFLTHPAKAYRLELMHILTGVSPLHASHISQSWSFRESVVHVSYKATDRRSGIPSLQAYEDETRSRLPELGLRLAQECRSEYGAFSYWRHDAIDGFYIKPRVNLRDAQ